MKKVLLFVIFTTVLALFSTGCEKVPAGHVGIKVYLLGGAKGVDSEELSVGRYWIGINEELFLYPTFTQNYVWTKNPAEGSPDDESITFQDQEGMSVNADVGISYHLDPTKVSKIFQKYRKGIGEITDVFLRNMVRDAFVAKGSILPIEDIYGKGKQKFLKDVEEDVKKQTKEIGIIIDRIYFVSDIKLPKTIIVALNKKIEATQRAQQRENELREAIAQAEKDVAKADGRAESVKKKAAGDAAAIKMRAIAQSEANLTLAKSLTPELIKYKTIETWDGKLPVYTGASDTLISIK